MDTHSVYKAHVYFKITLAYEQALDSHHHVSRLSLTFRQTIDSTDDF